MIKAFGMDLEMDDEALDFCYTTTSLIMNPKSNSKFENLDWTPLILMVSIFNLMIFSIWFPIRLWKMVKVSAPKVDEYTELGKKRKAIDQEYERLLDVDRGPFIYLYNCKSGFFFFFNFGFSDHHH